MAIIGFIAMLVLGAYFVAAGIVLGRLTAGFSGRISLGGFGLFVLGLAIVTFAIWYAPFTVSIK